MKIITVGKIPEKKKIKETCFNCKTVFEYTNNDIKSDDRDGDYVVCPICKKFIVAKLPY